MPFSFMNATHSSTAMIWQATSVVLEALAAPCLGYHPSQQLKVHAMVGLYCSVHSHVHASLLTVHLRKLEIRRIADLSLCTWSSRPVHKAV
jgi:hypothetical protein